MTMHKWALLAGVFLLVGCEQGGPEIRGNEKQREDQTQANPSASSLESAAIDAGVIPDASLASLSGAFERRSDLGVDLFCAVESGEEIYDVGMLAVFGADSRCEAKGTARRDGEVLHISLNGKKTCEFSASYDGVQIAIPGQLPDGCAAYCTFRASFAGVTFSKVGEGDGVAKSLVGKDRKKLCG